MTGSVALDVVIGLVFIYSLYSLLTTTLVEIIATLIRLRSTFLQYSIERMLDDGSKRKILSDEFYKQPLVKYLGSGALFGWVKKPSYLSAQNFSKALVNILKEGGENNGAALNAPLHQKVQTELTSGQSILSNTETGRFIRSLMEEAQGDMEKFKSLVEKWYDDTQERVTSWYKKWIQLITFIVGLAVAGVFNVDTPKIVDQLARDPKAREQYINMAQKLVENKEFAEQVYGDSVSEANLDTLQQTVVELRKQAMEANAVLSIPNERDLTSVIGWVITAIALSLGAPFWFDLLNKLMKLRSSVQTTTSPSASQGASSTNANTSKIVRVG